MVSSVIEKTIKNAAAEFAKGLKYFYPAHGNNGFNERNLTYQFAKEFSQRHKSCAFMEVPYHNSVLNKYNKRIDCLVTDSRSAIFVESKRLYNSIKASEVALDIERLSTDNTTAILGKLSLRKSPKNVYILILAETWQPSVVAWWLGKKSRITWDKKLLPTNLVRNSVEVSKHGEKTLYWLYGYTKIN